MSQPEPIPTPRHSPGARSIQRTSTAPAPPRARARIVTTAALGFVLALTLAGDARASEHCVTCEGPAASYVCVPEGLPPAAAQGIQGQMLCIQHFARSGPHAECSISRLGKGPCAGPPTPVSVRGGDAEGGANRVPFDGSGAAATRQPAPAPVPQGQDQRVTASSARAGSGSVPEPAPGAASAPAPQDAKSGLEKAGNAVGTAAKKTWDCLSSFLKDC